MSYIQSDGESVTRTFRLERVYDQILEEEADKRGVSVSHLLNQLVETFIFFLRETERMPSITLSNKTFKEILSCMDDECCKEAGRIAGEKVPREAFLIRGEKPNIPALRHLIENLQGKYAGWYRLNLHEGDGGYYYLKHDLGEKWTIFLEGYLDSLFRKVIGMDIEMEVFGESLMIKFVESIE